MRVRFWGTRGSIATPGAGTVRYGGNTACVEVRTESGALLILDCGSGARVLGGALLAAAGGQPVTGHILFSHLHWDHIQGFPFFVPVLVAGNSFRVYGPSSTDRSLQEALAGQMVYPYFPIHLRELRAELAFRDLGEGTLNLDGVEVQTRFVNHSVPALAYRISAGGATVVYCPDHEPFRKQLPDLRAIGDSGRGVGPEDFVHPGDRGHVAFLAGADLVIHDAQYTAAEYPQKLGWGHSPVEYSVAVAGAAGVKRLALFHHDPPRTDGLLAQLEDECRALAERISPELAVFAAAEGQEVLLSEAGPPVASGAAPADAIAAPARLDHPRVLVANDDPLLVQRICDALVPDGYELVVADNGLRAVERARAERPDLLLLDVDMPEMDGLEVVGVLRADPATRDLPIVMVTESDADAAAAFTAGVNDYLTRPFTPAVLRARARVWLLRSAAEGGPRRDTISSLGSQRATTAMLRRTLRGHQRENRPFAVLVIGGDGFVGQPHAPAYEAAEDVSARLAATLAPCLRPSDYLGRWRSSNEFLVILPGANRAGGQLVSERLQAAVASEFKHAEIPVTISVGLAAFPEHATTVEGLVARALPHSAAANEAGQTRAGAASPAGRAGDHA